MRVSYSMQLAKNIVEAGLFSNSEVISAAERFLKTPKDPSVEECFSQLIHQACAEQFRKGVAR